MPPPDSPPPVGSVRVMVSSTALDLPEHRKTVMDAILRVGWFPLAMEHATAASDSDALRFSLAMVDEADLYIGIFGFRYGCVPVDSKANPQGWSVTEHELRRALTRKIPALIFLMHDNHPVTRKDVDQDSAKVAKLEALKTFLLTGICGTFSSPQELQARVIQALNEQKPKLLPSREAAPAPRDRAGRIPQPPELYAVPPYTSTNAFVGRAAELARLDAWGAASAPVMVVEAIGGMGKSALTWEWVRQSAEARIPGLAGRMWWSFYERGTSMQTFLRHALAYTTRQDPEALRGLDSDEAGGQLLAELCRRPHLLVLDGFERVLTAYHRLDKAHLRDDRVPVDARECTNPRDGDVLRQLVHCGPSKVLVSTRLMPRALQDRASHQPIPGVLHLDLQGMAPGDALEMVRETGIRGDSTTILRFADHFDRHALLLRIVCGVASDYRPHPGSFDAWLADPSAGGGLKLSEMPLKQRYTHILEYAFRGLPAMTRQLLARIAVLSDSADYGTVAVLNPFLSTTEKQTPEGSALVDDERAAVAQLHQALGDLEDRGLLQWNREENTYDLHPVVRAYAFEQLEEQDRKRAYNRIRDHFAAMPPENLEDASELAHLKNSLEIVRALIGAGRVQEAVDLYEGDLARNLLFSIGANHVVVELLEPMLRRHAADVPLLDKRSGARIVNDLALALAWLGRNHEASLLLHQAIQLHLELADWDNVCIELGNLSAVEADLNHLAATSRCLDLASALAEERGFGDGITIGLLHQMSCATTMGAYDQAVAYYMAFQRRPRPPRNLYRTGDVEYQQADLQFRRGRPVVRSLDHAEGAAVSGRNISKQRLTAELRAEWELSLGKPAAALTAIDHALAIARRTGVPVATQLEMRALALARLGRDAEARETLSEAGDADAAQSGQSKRSPYFAAAAWMALGDHERARRLIGPAYAHAWADGPPYSHWHSLSCCRALLAELGEPEPGLPLFDPAREQPAPYEAGIRAIIGKQNKSRSTTKK
jgi:tetratricopeptide (TPR) repeat protein